MLNMSQNSSRQTAEDLIQQVQKYEWARTGSGRAGCSRDDLDCEAHGFNGPRVAEQPPSTCRERCLGAENETGNRNRYEN
jgi:hypothetical protein